MALSDYIERLQQISGEGPRATDFVLLNSQRNKTRRSFLDELKQAQARNIRFNAVADQDMGQPGANGYIGGNGKFNGYFSMYPLKGKLRVSSPYGVHREGHKSAHTGIDWADPAGTPIYAPADATVRSTLFNKIYGNQTILDFGGGYSAMFGHQKGFANIKPGQQVKAGQLIGYVGSTGWSTGPHLHFETWYNNKPVNPLSYFH
jgi:murein DD-endopeptidase MepM/ murein hydrolase activator NlpD